jgi:DNA-binding GntR family transcriptional regulator
MAARRDPAARRAEISALLATADDAIPGDELARRVGVSRQQIVHDIGLLRAQGTPVGATVRGYVLQGAAPSQAILAGDGRDGREPGGLPRLRAPSLGDLTYRSIRDSILTGGSRMGARLVDVRLAEQLGVSRGTVRQALTRLVDEGLAVERPRQGTYVRTFGPDDLIALYNVRVAIEPIAARLTVRRRPPLTSLRSLLADTGRAYADGNMAAILEAESAFHTELVTLAGNAHLLDLYRAARSRFRMAISVTQASLAPELRQATDDHPPIVEALASGDESVAAGVVHWHIVENVDQALRALGANADQLLPPLWGSLGMTPDAGT